MRKIKRILAAVSAVTMLAAGTVSVSASFMDLCFDAGTEEYTEYCQTLTKVPYEEKLGAMLGALTDKKWYGVYFDPSFDENSYIDEGKKYPWAWGYKLEVDAPNNGSGKERRTFMGIRLYFVHLCTEGEKLTYSIESINDFLKEKGYDAKVENEEIDRLFVTYGENVDTEGKIDVLYALYNEYGFLPLPYITYNMDSSGGAAFCEDGEESYLLGDANGDKKCDVRDCACIADALAMGSADSLPNVADYNLDGKKNVRDAAKIAQYLAIPKHATGDIWGSDEEWQELKDELELRRILEESYYLRQLFEMSDNEFLALNGRKGKGIDYYNEIKQDAERVDKLFNVTEYGGISGVIRRNVSDPDINYKKGTPEVLIHMLLNDMVEYKIFSPSFEERDVYLQLEFPDYKLSAEHDTITDKQIMEFAKIYFCVDQAFDLYYKQVGTLG